MTYKVYITSDAHRDLSDITGYIKNKLCNSKAANDFLSEIEKYYEELKSNPLMFERCRDARLNAMGYRKIPIKNYICFYKVDEKEKTVYIMRIIYGRRDYGKLI